LAAPPHTPTPATAPHTPGLAFELLAVACGGVLGALARHGIGLAIGPIDPAGAGLASWPLATALANALGCAGLGLALATLERRAVGPLVRPFLVVGVFGSFTTYSTFAVETILLIEAGRALAAAIYAGGSMLLGLLCFRAAHAWIGPMR